MKKKFLLTIFLASIILIITIFNVMSKINSRSKINERITDITDHSFLSAIKITGSDIYIGREDAKLTIIDYSSFTCPHCADFFKNIFPKMEKEYIKTGLVRFVHRSIATDVLAFNATKISKCGNISSEDRYKLIKLIYLTQSNWIIKDEIKSSEKLKKISLTSGISMQNLDLCLKDEKFSQMIIDERDFISKNIGIVATPTLIVGKKKIRGFVDYDIVKSVIEEELIKNKN